MIFLIFLKNRGFFENFEMTYRTKNAIKLERGKKMRIVVLDLLQSSQKIGKYKKKTISDNFFEFSEMNILGDLYGYKELVLFGVKLFYPTIKLF